MKLLANENFPLASVLYLRKQGHNIAYIGEDSFGIKDSEVMDFAIKEERTILTFDRDYGELIFKFNYKPEKGVIYLRIDEFAPDEPGRIIDELIRNKNLVFERALSVVDSKSVRQRKY